jgi:hypothetical protein
MSDSNNNKVRESLGQMLKRIRHENEALKKLVDALKNEIINLDKRNINQ